MFFSLMPDLLFWDGLRWPGGFFESSSVPKVIHNVKIRFSFNAAPVANCQP
jgi:hypothetical protein